MRPHDGVRRLERPGDALHAPHSDRRPAFTYAHEHKGAPEYAFWNEDVAHENLPPLSFEIMQHEVFNHENGRFRDWWYASLYDDYLVFYSPYDPERRQPPVKAWKRYKQVWPKEDEAG